MREVIVLAGGFGTRLAHVVPDICKPMAPISGQPFLKLLLNQLSDAKFEKVVIADGFRREQIEDYFGSFYRGMEIIYSSEDMPLLTGGAIRKALRLCDSEYVFVLNGDSYCDVDFSEMKKTAIDNDGYCDVVIAVKEMVDYSRYGSVEFNENGIVTGFLEKQSRERGYINAGMYLLRSNVLEFLPEVFSFESDYLETTVSRGRILSYASKGQFIDIGVPEDYERAQELLSNLTRGWKIAFFDRDGTLNVDTGHLFEPEKLELVHSMMPILRRYSDDPDYKIVVVTNQAGIAKGLYDVEQMKALHRSLDARLAQEGCRVDSYYYCPHHPDFTGECGCRKPKPGMLRAAMLDYDATPSECIMFGDKESDLLAAQSAGVPFEWVRGHEIEIDGYL